MLTDERVNEYYEKIRDRIDAVNSKYIKEIGAQIQQIGKLNRASIIKLEQMNKFGASSKKMKRELAIALNKSQADVEKLLQEAVHDEYHSAEFANFVIGRDITDPKKNKALQRYMEAVARQTAESFENWSNTTVIDQNYQNIISDAIDAVSRGVTDYRSAMRRSIKKYGGDGLSVVYDSGVKRRLDTAVRQNILDGTRQISQQCAKMIGEEIGADGVELSAHPYSALDHEPCQGRQYTNENYELMQSAQDFQDVDGNHYVGFKRPITQWNCRHFASPILLGISPRRYTDVQLEQWKQANHKGIDLDGKHYTIYQASQLMRNLEAEVRRQKDIANLCEASGDDVGRRNAQWEITKCKAKYKQVAELSKLSQRPEKMVVNSYKDDGKVFTSQNGDDIMSMQGKRNNIILNNQQSDDYESDLGKFRKILKSDTDITQEYYNALQEKFSHGRDIGKAAFAKYVQGNTIADSHFSDRPRFDKYGTKKIYMNFESDLSNSRGIGATWFHEHGHYVDDAMGSVSNNETFQKLLRSDMNRYIRNYIHKFKLSSMSEAMEMISAELSDMRNHSAVSDIMDALTSGGIKGVSYHDREYWKDDSVISAEAFAHMFEAEFDSTRYFEIKKYFPEALQFFEKLIGGVK